MKSLAAKRFPQAAQSADWDRPCISANLQLTNLQLQCKGIAVWLVNALGLLLMTGDEIKVIQGVNLGNHV